MGKIILRGIKVSANHGCLPGEEKIYRIYEIDLSLTIDLKKAGLSDELSDTIDYVEIDKIIREQMQIRSALVEHAASRTLKKLKENFSVIEKIKIRICKLNPPVDGYMKKMCIKLEE